MPCLIGRQNWHRVKAWLIEGADLYLFNVSSKQQLTATISWSYICFTRNISFLCAWTELRLNWCGSVTMLSWTDTFFTELFSLLLFIYSLHRIKLCSHVNWVENLIVVCSSVIWIYKMWVLDYLKPLILILDTYMFLAFRETTYSLFT